MEKQNGFIKVSNHRRTSCESSQYGVYQNAAVAASSEIGSKTGSDVLKKGGNAIDAAVAVTMISGVVNAHNSGIGGGCAILLYDKKNEAFHAVTSGEKAPGAASQDMYLGQVEKSELGGLAVGVPGELRGLHEIHRRFGLLSWAEVIAPAIKLCKEGAPLTSAMIYAMETRLITQQMKSDFSLYFDKNDNPLPEGTLIKRPKLAATLEKITHDPHSFYSGSLAADIVADLQERGGIITMEDMTNYNSKWTHPSVITLPGDLKVFSNPAPGSGPVLNSILSTMAGYDLQPNDVADLDKEILFYHRFAEACKFAAAVRTKMGDPEHIDIKQIVENASSLEVGEMIRQKIDDNTTHDVPYYEPCADVVDNHGTTHLCVIDQEGNVVSLTTSINLYFGCKIRGRRTGIVFNSVMCDFSVPNKTNYFGLPPSPSNFIAAGKRPMSSKCPSIVWDEKRKKVRMITGASGGSKIPSVTAMNIMDVLWLGRSNAESIDRKRIYHQLIPNHIEIEQGFPTEITAGLRDKGHNVEYMKEHSVIQSIDVNEMGLVAVTDHRKGGMPCGF